jgi:hypothetical protein
MDRVVGHASNLGPFVGDGWGERWCGWVYVEGYYWSESRGRIRSETKRLVWASGLLGLKFRSMIPKKSSVAWNVLHLRVADFFPQVCFFLPYFKICQVKKYIFLTCQDFFSFIYLHQEQFFISFLPSHSTCATQMRRRYFEFNHKFASLTWYNPQCVNLSKYNSLNTNSFNWVVFYHCSQFWNFILSILKFSPSHVVQAEAISLFFSFLHSSTHVVQAGARLRTVRFSIRFKPVL